MSAKTEFQGFLRQDGRKGIRNTILVVYLVECAHHVAREIVYPYRKQGVHLIGFSGCYPNQYAFDMMARLCTHPNTGGVLLVSLGCESFDRRGLARVVIDSGRPVETLVIQERGGTLTTVDQGQTWLEETLAELEDTTARVTMSVDELVVGAICGGSDATSGITANPAIGRCFDLLVDNNASATFEEGGELIGCEQIMADRAVTPALGEEILSTMEKTARYYTTMGHGSFAVGNSDGGLTTVEEKSMGAYAKSGSSPIRGAGSSRGGHALLGPGLPPEPAERHEMGDVAVLSKDRIPGGGS